MASLQFRYDGYKRPERGREVCFFPPRYNFPYYGVDMSEKDKAEEKKEVKVEKDALVEQEETEKENKKEAKVDNSDTTQISEILIKNLTTTEERLNVVKSQVEFAKTFFDDLIYKLDSLGQIVKIVQANENRRLRGPQGEVASLKTSQDSVDEVLELLQGPVFQNVLRQFLVSMLVKE